MSQDSVTVSVQGENEESHDSNHYRMDNEALDAKISAIMSKKKAGHELTPKETQTITRLNRVRASRRFRAK